MFVIKYPIWDACELDSSIYERPSNWINILLSQYYHGYTKRLGPGNNTNHMHYVLAFDILLFGL